MPDTRHDDMNPDEIHRLPMLILMPHGGCNCRCIMCDIWMANSERRVLSVEDLERQLDDLEMLGVGLVTLTGGEAMMSPNLWTFCRLLRARGVRISLMSTGLMLARHAADVVEWCDAVTVSLDGGRERHDATRRVPRAYDRLCEGVAAVKNQRPGFPVVARCVLQRSNFRELPYIVHAARDLGADVLSFLPADVTSEAFNRPRPWDAERVSGIALDREEVSEFARIVEDLIARYADAFESGFIHESPEALRRMPRYYAAENGDGAFPEVRCNAPWVSAVVEADRTVRPCYFQAPIGHLSEGTLAEVLNSEKAVAFRRNLNVREDSVCQRCVCPLHLDTGFPARA